MNLSEAAKKLFKLEQEIKHLQDRRLIYSRMGLSSHAEDIHKEVIMKRKEIEDLIQKNSKP